MFSDKEEANKGKVETIMGNGTKIIGDLETKGSVRVEGEITGKIKAKGDVFVGKAGNIQTEIEARKVVIAGKVEANIVAHKKLEILETGILKGDIKTDKLIIKEGATFIGNSKLLNKNNQTLKPELNSKNIKKDNKNKENK